MSQQTSGLHSVTNVVGTSISGVFLYLIALVNLFVLLSIARLYKEMRSGRYDPAELERQLDKRGLMNRLLGGYARRVDTSWKLFPVGFLFGLGFDTATEIALLVLAGSAVVGGLPLYAILSLPILFAAGMCTFDTLDGYFMNFAYDWAFANPVRKVFYNLTITCLSVAVAFFVGTIEVLGLIGQQAHLSSPFWDFVGRFNLNTAGFVIVGLFVATWVVALVVLATGSGGGEVERRRWPKSRATSRCQPDRRRDLVDMLELEVQAMHELSICSAIASTAARHADGRTVSQVKVQIGHLRQVVPDALQFSWEVVSSTSDLKDAELVIEQVPAVVECHGCGERTTLDMPVLACGTCGGFDVKLLSGEELLVVSIDLVDA